MDADYWIERLLNEQEYRRFGQQTFSPKERRRFEVLLSPHIIGLLAMFQILRLGFLH